MKAIRPWSARAWLATAHVMTGLPVGFVLAWLTLVLALVPPVLRVGMPWLTRVQRSRFEAFLGVRIPPVPAAPSLRDRSLGGRSATTCSPRWWGGGRGHGRARVGRGPGGGDGVPAAAHPGPPLVFPSICATHVVLAIYIALGVVLLLFLAPDPGAGDGHARPVDGPHAARPQPPGAGPAGRDADREPGRRGRRGRRRTPPHRAGPARRRPAAAGLPGDEPRAGPRDADATCPSRPARRSSRRTRRPSRRSRSCASSSAACTRPCSTTGAWTRRCPASPRGPPCRCGCASTSSATHSPTIEAVAYFIVSEALTNIAKHAAATRAEVTVTPRARPAARRWSPTTAAAAPGSTAAPGCAAWPARRLGGRHPPPGQPAGRADRRSSVELPCES